MHVCAYNSGIIGILWRFVNSPDPHHIYDHYIVGILMVRRGGTPQTSHCHSL